MGSKLSPVGLQNLLFSLPVLEGTGPLGPLACPWQASLSHGPRGDESRVSLAQCSRQPLTFVQIQRAKRHLSAMPTGLYQKGRTARSVCRACSELPWSPRALPGSSPQAATVRPKEPTGATPPPAISLPSRRTQP